MKLGCVVLVALLFSIQASADNDDAAAAGDVPVKAVRASVRTAVLRQQMMSENVTVYGQVTPSSRRVTVLSEPRAGQIAEMKVLVGQRVHKGQVLLTFANAPETDQAWRQAFIAVNSAQSERSRMAQLLAQHLATAGQLAAAEKTFADAKAQLEAQQQLGAGRHLSPLKAPCDGWVSAVNVAAGTRVTAGTQLLELSPDAATHITFAAEVADSQRIQVGMPVKIVSLVGADRTVPGRVERIAVAVTASTQQVGIGVTMPVGVFMSGERVKGILTLQRQLSWVVPRLAVLTDDEGAYLYQVKNGHAVRIAVRTGIENAENIAVDGPFLPGAPVVIVGNYELTSGMAVRVQAPVYSGAL
jgi:RND family efflux transporter MFP subunit